MALDAAGVDALQNSTPTNWSGLDQQLADRGDFDKNRFAGDSKLYVKFSMRPRLNLDKSNAANRPIYEDCEYVQIMMPGEKHNIIERPAASMRDDLRFPAHYKQFKDGVTEQMVGTPLKVLPFLTEAQIAELEWFKIRTVDALANLSDSVMQQFMGARELQQKANAWLEASKDGGNLAEENRQLKARLDALEALMEERTAPKASKAAKAAEDILA